MTTKHEHDVHHKAAGHHRKAAHHFEAAAKHQLAAAEADDMTMKSKRLTTLI